MNWSNVKLIFLREVRDQLRDRRTLFTIAVLPVLLYPLMGMTYLHVSQFLHEQPTLIRVVGTDHLPDSPPLIVGTRFHADVCTAEEARLLTLDPRNRLPEESAGRDFTSRARALIQEGRYAAVIRFPAGFSESLTRFRAPRKLPNKGRLELGEGRSLPVPEVIFDAANDQSRVANARIHRVLATWRRAIVRQYLSDRNIPPNVIDPFTVRDVDISREMSRRAAVWSKILPFVVFIWALTGAFYPAIDLCAGEKERGTLETLLSSPAERSEIVLGKLLTIMGFSSATSLLNLLSMALTGSAIILLQPAQIPIGPPPIAALGWLFLALLPISALFSALALAIAAFARSTKEGQYYLMPLLLISLPLMILPMLPAVELKIGTSLIPITGMMLLLRALVEGQFAAAALYVGPVLLVTGGCCLLAIRWAVDQFNNESVLFRESERLDLRLRLLHLVRDRGATPTLAQGIACGVILLTIRFFATFAARTPETWNEFAVMQFVMLAVLVAGPALLMTAVLTRSPRATLLLNRARGMSLLSAAALAVAIHPLAMLVARGIQWLYPINESFLEQLKGMEQVIASAPSIWHILALMALTPAICEELAFRGFILSGLRHMGSRWGAILISSVFFGLAHGILQQSISAVMMGAVIGYIAVQTRSLLPGILFHLIYNALSLISAFGMATKVAGSSWLGLLFEVDGQAVSYRSYVVLIGVAVSAGILYYFHRLPHESTPEEALREALNHQSAGAAAS